MRGLFLTFVFVLLLFQGGSAPFIAALAYVWVDIVKPQELAYSIINGKPLALIAGVCTIVFYFLNDRKSPPKFTFVLFLLCVFAGWITLTTAIADPGLQAFSWGKWDWAFKVLIFTIFMPYVFRSRVQIESFILVLILSIATLFFSAGVKTLLGSGGYGVLAVMGASNTGLAEGSTLAAVCIMLIPLIHFAYNDSIIFPQNKYLKIFALGLLVTAIATVIGTAARTGVIAGGVLIFRYVIRSKRKFLWLSSMAVVVGVLLLADVFSSVWGSRMSTINSYDQDSSALGRIAVWKWTLGFVADHPLGGGFDAFRLNGIAAVSEHGISYYQPGRMDGKAFHNIYFEVLGEQGIPGLIIYILIIALVLVKLHHVYKKFGNDSELKWASNLAKSLTDAIIVFLAAGMFIGIAYQPYIFYVIAISIALEQYIERCTSLKKTILENDQKKFQIKSAGKY